MPDLGVVVPPKNLYSASLMEWLDCLILPLLQPAEFCENVDFL